MDGAETAPSATNLTFSLVASDTDINLDSLRHGDRAALWSATQTIAGMRFLQSAASTLFSGVQLTLPTRNQVETQTNHASRLPKRN